MALPETFIDVSFEGIALMHTATHIGISGAAQKPMQGRQISN
jgi:hypothetical protein